MLETGSKSDAQSVAMASGKANVMDVVTAVAETDVAVSTLVSVRDRAIQSYEDIIKMSDLSSSFRGAAQRRARNPCIRWCAMDSELALDAPRNDDGVSGKRE